MMSATPKERPRMIFSCFVECAYDNICSICADAQYRVQHLRDRDHMQLLHQPQHRPFEATCLSKPLLYSLTSSCHCSCTQTQNTHRGVLCCFEYLEPCSAETLPSYHHLSILDSHGSDPKQSTLHPHSKAFCSCPHQWREDRA